jgi:hypothetical protein
MPETIHNQITQNAASKKGNAKEKHHGVSPITADAARGITILK